MNAKDVRAYLDEQCRVRGHVPVPIKDCDDWPGKCVCLLVDTNARGCRRCRVVPLPMKSPKEKS